MKPVVIVVRHPEYEDEIRVFPDKAVDIIYLDLGASFDITRPYEMEGREGEIIDDLKGLCASIVALDLPRNHPALKHMEGQVQEVLDAFHIDEEVWPTLTD